MTTWYYGQNGTSGGAGTTFGTRKATHAQLISAGLTSGDTVFVCAAVAGLSSRYTLTEQLLVVSGVTYHVFPGHYILLEVNTPGLNEGAIHAVNKSNFVIEPLDGFLQCGDDSSWDPVNAWFTYSADRQLNFTNCSNFRLIGTGSGNWDTTASNFVVHGGSRYVGNHFGDDCDLYLVRGLEITNHGTNNTVPGLGIDSDDGNMVAFSGTRAWVNKVCIARAGHAAYASAAGVVVSECDFDGDWTGYTPNADAGRGAPIERSGQRCFSLTGGNTDADDNNGGQSPYGPQMFDNCIFRKAGSAGDDHDNAGSEIYGNHVIVRFCYYWDGCNDAFRAGTFESVFPTGSVNYQQCYNNTCYGNGKLFDFRNNAQVDDAFQQITVINNIFDEMRGSYFSGTQNSIHYPGNTLDGWPNRWKGGRYAGNLAKMHSSAPDGATITIRSLNESAVSTTYTWTNIDDAFPSNWFASNLNVSPTYAGSPEAGVRTKAAFAPNGGAETGTAEPHAIANGSGSGSTTLILDSGQSRMFFDCWDMESLGLEADWIKIGSGSPVQIAANGINYATDTVTLTAARTWSDNDEVFLVLNDGATVVEDIGAGQAAAPAVVLASGYELLKGLGDGFGNAVPNTFEIIDVGNVLTYTFTGLTPGQEYYFRLRAYDAAGNFGAFTSPRIFATTLL